MDEIKNESAQNVTDSVNTQFNDTEQKNTNQAEYSLISLDKLFEMDIPPRKWMAYPFIQEKSISMIYASRGLGKTYAAMTIALGIASGTNVFDFVITEPHSVVYIDGEMAANDFSDRMKSLCSGLNIYKSCMFKNFKILTNDLQPLVLPNIGRPEGQKKITPLLKDADFIVIDNLSALCSYGKENEAESWTHMQQWLLNLKRDGKSVLVIDHSGKNEDNRGTSKKQDIMDSVIALSKPDGAKITDGARFIMNFTKSRNVCGEDVVAKQYWLQSNENGFLFWVSEKPTEPNDKKEHERKIAQELKAQGKTTREIAEMMGIGKTKAAELVKQSVPQEPDVKIDPETNLPIITLDELDESKFPQ